MATKVKDLKITFDMGEFTWGDLMDVRQGKLLDVCARLGIILDDDGKRKPPEEVVEILRGLAFTEITLIDQALSDAMESLINPEDEETGKN